MRPRHSIVWAGFLLGLPASDYCQSAAGPTASCASRFPYGPEQFVEKLLTVAGEVEADAVLAKFQQSFGLTLRSLPRKNPRISTYSATECQWYTRVLITSVEDAKLSQLTLTRVSLSVGDLSRRLLFDGPRGDECLRVVFVNKSLTTSGWTAGPRPSGEIASWIYRKGRTKLVFSTTDWSVNPEPACVTEITVLYR
jgi:hypothetical protein